MRNFIIYCTNTYWKVWLLVVRIWWKRYANWREVGNPWARAKPPTIILRKRPTSMRKPVLPMYPLDHGRTQMWTPDRATVLFSFLPWGNTIYDPDYRFWHTWNPPPPTSPSPSKKKNVDTRSKMKFFGWGRKKKNYVHRHHPRIIVPPFFASWLDRFRFLNCSFLPFL